MVEQYKVEEFLFTNCLKVKRKSGMGYYMRCPVCGDSKRNPNKRRCHVDYYAPYDEWIYTCYNGDCPEPNGNIQSLYSFVKGVSYKEAADYLEDREYNAETIKNKLSKSGNFIEEEDDETDTGSLDLDILDCYTESDEPVDRIGKKFVQKLLDFKKDRCIDGYSCMIAHSGKYRGRIIIPIYINDELVYFQGRTILDNVEPKYLNPVLKKENIILNCDKFDRNKFIIVAEGIIDAFTIENNQGTSCIGASISDSFLEKVFELTDKGVIIAIDNPRIDKSGIKNMIKLLNDSKFNKRLRYFFMPFDDIKDLNQLKVERNIDNIYDFVLKYSYSYFKSSIMISRI